MVHFMDYSNKSKYDAGGHADAKSDKWYQGSGDSYDVYDDEWGAIYTAICVHAVSDVRWPHHINMIIVAVVQNIHGRGDKRYR
jgi:hypothetical protein